MRSGWLQLMLLCGCSFLRSVSSDDVNAPDCALYTHRTDASVWLDCRRDAGVCCYDEAEFASSRRMFVGIRRSDNFIHWELSPPLLGNQTINRLPLEAFHGFNERLESSVVLVLRRLHLESFSLAALSSLPSLRHLSLRESNVTCLPAGVFAGVSDRLQSLSLLENPNLSCLQPGVFDGLSRLSSLQISDSPRLLRLDPGAFCGLTSVAELSLRLPNGAGVPGAALSRLPGSLSTLRLARGSQQPDDSAALEFLPGLADFICTRATGLELNGLQVDRLLAEQLHTPMPDFCTEFVVPSTVGGSNGFTGSRNHTNFCDREVMNSGCAAGCVHAFTLSSFVTSRARASAAPLIPLAPLPSAAAASANERGVVSAAEKFDRPNLAGTVLLMASAFTAGVMASLYCFLYRRRLGRSKMRSASMTVSAEGPQAASAFRSRRGSCCVPIMIADEEPVKLVGFRSLSEDSGECRHQLFTVCSSSLVSTPCPE